MIHFGATTLQQRGLSHLWVLLWQTVSLQVYLMGFVRRSVWKLWSCKIAQHDNKYLFRYVGVHRAYGLDRMIRAGAMVVCKQNKTRLFNIKRWKNNVLNKLSQKNQTVPRRKWVCFWLGAHNKSVQAPPCVLWSIATKGLLNENRSYTLKTLEWCYLGSHSSRLRLLYT